MLEREIKQAAKVSRPVSGITYDDAKEIGILYSVTDLYKHEIIKTFIKELEADKKKVSILTFLDKDKENFEFKYNFFEAKDFNIWGKSTSKSVAEFISQNFDYLLYIDLDPHIYNNYILSKSKARCRIGKYFPEQANYFELMINLAHENDTQSLINQIKHFTKKI